MGSVDKQLNKVCLLKQLKIEVLKYAIGNLKRNWHSRYPLNKFYGRDRFLPNAYIGV